MTPCPHCNHPKTHKHGDRRRKCPACGKTFSLDKKSENGRPTIGDRPMTGYERLKRHLKKLSENP
jgi:transposase-like protein